MDKAKLVEEQGKQCSGIVKVDPRLPLDERQVFKLKSSWKAITRHPFVCLTDYNPLFIFICGLVSHQ
jgi:hypothetical protein